MNTAHLALTLLHSCALLFVRITGPLTRAAHNRVVVSSMPQPHATFLVFVSFVTCDLRLLAVLCGWHG